MGERFLLPDRPLASLHDWRMLGGGEALSLARDLGPSRTIAEITASGLRGRGGGGFVTGRKWAGVLAQGGTHRYAVCNAAEGEPATFKDRALLRANPYQLVEGLAVAALAVGAREAYIGVKERFVVEGEALARAVEEMQARGAGGRRAHHHRAGPRRVPVG